MAEVRYFMGAEAGEGTMTSNHLSDLSEPSVTLHSPGKTPPQPIKFPPPPKITMNGWVWESRVPRVLQSPQGSMVRS